MSLPKSKTRFCFMCWHGGCESCSPGECDCWCCPKAAIGPPLYPRAQTCFELRVQG